MAIILTILTLAAIIFVPYYSGILINKIIKFNLPEPKIFIYIKGLMIVIGVPIILLLIFDLTIKMYEFYSKII